MAGRQLEIGEAQERHGRVASPAPGGEPAGDLGPDRLAERFPWLQTLAVALSRTLSILDVGEVTARECASGMHATTSFVAVLKGEDLSLVHAEGPAPWLRGNARVVPLSSVSPAAEAVRRRALLLTFPGDPRFPGFEGSWAAIPLMTGEQPMGVLALHFPRGQDFDRSQKPVLLAASRHCTLALERARLFEAERQARSRAEDARRDALEAVQLRDKLLSVVSHDLRNPLQAVALGTEVLLRNIHPDHPDAAFLRRGLERIAKATRNMTSLVEELVDIAGAQAGRALNLMLRPVDLAALVRQVAEEVDAGRGLVRVRAGQPLRGDWDAARMERVVANLLHNAIKYSPGRTPVTVRVRITDGKAEIAVSDRGLGIPAADLPHVFEWFRRGSNVVGRLPGTGVGLASARRIVEQHGGTISVASVEGRGSTFTVLLPVGRSRS